MTATTEPPTLVTRLRLLRDSLGKTPTKEIIHDILLDAIDMEQELLHWQDKAKALEIELSWRDHDQTSGGDEKGAISDGAGSK